jgi:simple sugar transport system permease protein
MMLFNKLNEDLKSNAFRYAGAMTAVVFIGSLLILAQGENPGNAFFLILKGSFGSLIAVGNTLRHATPCILVGIAATVTFKCGINNLGLEGQLYFGALVSAVIGAFVQFPPVVHVAFCLIVGSIAGLLYALIPALLKLVFNVNELVVSLMCNYIAVLVTEYITMWWILGGRAAQGSFSIQTPLIHKTAMLPNLIRGSSSSWGLFLALLVAAFVYILFKYTIKGYELKQVGENRRFAQVGGINITKTFLSIFLFSGLIAGLAGAVETTGAYGRFTSKFAPNIGWNGIMIAHISARDPVAVVVVSLIWGALNAGALSMERTTSLNKLTINILQMLFVLFVSIDYWAVVKKMSKNIHRRKGEV